MTTQTARDRLLLFSSVAAPACFLGGWLLMRPIGGQSEPGGWWTAAHSVWLIGFVLFAVAALRARSRLPMRTTGQRIAVNSTVALVVASAAANVVQLVLDLVGGFRAMDRQQLHDMFAAFQDIPGVEIAIYGVGAQVIFLGLVALAMLASRRTGAWAATLVATGTAVMAGGLMVGRNHWLVPAGMTVLLIGLAMMGWRLTGRQADLPA